MIETSPGMKSTAVFDSMASWGHEQVVFCYDEAIGLKAVIALHNTVLGPAMGGTRMWAYASEQEAVQDVLRLSRGMTYKNSIAGLNAGGGKAVIIGDARKIKNEVLMRRFGRFIHSLNGKYWTAEDMNMTTQDMEYIRMETPFVTGISESMGGSGDPSPVTAYGVYLGMKACAKKAYGTDSLADKKVVVQGAGHVGTHLIGYLVKENARVAVSDIYEDKLAEVCKNFNVSVLPADEIYDAEMDIYAPCAMGATLNSETIPKLKCDIVAGAANNQLEDENVHDRMLQSREILYGPDFLINSGGITNVYYEQQGNYNKQKVYEQTERIYDVCTNVLKYSEQHDVTTHQSALQLAMKRIEDIGKVKLSY